MPNFQLIENSGFNGTRLAIIGQQLPVCNMSEVGLRTHPWKNEVMGGKKGDMTCICRSLHFLVVLCRDSSDKHK